MGSSFSSRFKKAKAKMRWKWKKKRVKRLKKKDVKIGLGPNNIYCIKGVTNGSPDADAFSVHTPWSHT